MFLFAVYTTVCYVCVRRNVLTCVLCLMCFTLCVVCCLLCCAVLCCVVLCAVGCRVCRVVNCLYVLLNLCCVVLKFVCGVGRVCRVVNFSNVLCCMLYRIKCFCTTHNKAAQHNKQHTTHETKLIRRKTQDTRHHTTRNTKHSTLNVLLLKSSSR